LDGIPRPSRANALRLLVSVDHDARAVEGAIRAAQGCDDAIATAFDRTKVDEEHLIFAMIDDLAEQMPTSREIGPRQLTLEDRVLQVVAESTHRFVDPAQAEVVRNVVADQIRVPHQPPTVSMAAWHCYTVSTGFSDNRRRPLDCVGNCVQVVFETLRGRG
jgi:hypothetical protein